MGLGAFELLNLLIKFGLDFRKVLYVNILSLYNEGVLGLGEGRRCKIVLEPVGHG